jgi:hypothetical protein
MRGGRTAVVAGCVLAVALAVPAAASATIVNVQTGTYASSTTGSVTLTLPAASTSGTLLVAALSNGQTTPQAKFTGPAGWTFGIQTHQNCCGQIEIWYYENNPGGISSATFTASTGTNYLAGQLSEWNGVVSSSSLDKTGTATHAAATSLAVSTAANLTTSGELGVTIFNSSLTGLTSFTAGAGWAPLFSDPTTDGDVSDYELGLPSGAKATETETAAGGSPQWLGDIATFKPATCTGGSLTLGAPSSVSFPGVTVNGTNQTVSTTLSLTPSDLSGSGAGWNVTGTSTTFTNASSKTLSTTATSITSASAATTGGNCVVPTNAITYPVTLPAGATAPTAVKLYNAAAATGKGPTTVNLTAQLSVPANAYNGTYSSTWTIAVASGP